MEIANTSNGTLISGSADNDSIINAGENVTIDSGAGSDSITLSSDGREYVALSSVTSAEIIGFENGTLDSSDAIYLVDGKIYNSTFEFKDEARIINNLSGSVSITSSAAENTFDLVIDNQKVRSINDSISAAFDSNIDYYALGNDSTLTAVTGTTKINDIELITNGNLTITGKNYELDDGSSYNLAQTITGLSGGDSITVNDLWSNSTFAYYVSDDGTTISRISDNSIVYTGSADTLSSLNFGTISFMDYFTQTVGEVVDAFNTRYATFNSTTLTIDAKTLRTNLNTQIAAAQSELASVTTVTSTLVITQMDDIIKNVISSDVSIKNLLNEDMMSVMSGQIDTILSAGGDPLNIFSNLEDYNGDIFSWICDSLIVPVAQILGDSTLDRLAANLSDRLSSHGTKTIILNGSEDTVSIGAYYGDSVDASASKMENLIIASENVTDSPQRDLVLLTGSNTHSGNIQNAVVLGINTVVNDISDIEMPTIVQEVTALSALKNPTSLAVNFINNFLIETKKSIDNGSHGNDILTDAVRATTNFKGIDSLVDAMILDATDDVTTPGAWQSDSWATYNEDRATLNLAENFGIIFDNEDTGAVIGMHSGGDIAYNAEDIVPESGSITGTLQPTPSEESVTKYFTNANGENVPVNIIWKTDKLFLMNPADDEADVDDAEGRDLSELTDNQRTAFNTIVEGLDRWWITQACSLNDASYGLSMENATLKIALVSSSTEEDFGFTAATSPKDENGVIDMLVNFDIFDSIDSSNANGDTEDSTEQIYLDRTIAHEMTHAVMFYYDLMDLDENEDSRLPGQYTEGIADFTHGGDDSNADYKYEFMDLAGNYDSLKSALSLTSGTGEENFYTAGYMMMRYLTKQATDGESIQFAISDDFTVRNVHDGMYLTDSGTQNVSSEKTNIGKFSVNEDNGTITYIDKKLTDDSVTIGADTSLNYVYKESNGNDTLYGFNSDDTIEIASGNYQTIENDNDLIIAIGNSSLTLKDSAANNVNISKVTETTAADFMRTLIDSDKAAARVEGDNLLAALDSAINQHTNFKNLETARNALVADFSSSLSTYEKLKTYSGIDSMTGDSGSLLGLNAGGSTNISPEDLIIEDGNLTGTIKPDSSMTYYSYVNDEGETVEYKVNWDLGNVYLGSEEDTEPTTTALLSTLNEEETKAFYLITEGLYRWWIPDAAKFADKSLGLNLDGATIRIRLVQGDMPYVANTVLTGEYLEEVTENNDITIFIPLSAVTEYYDLDDTDDLVTLSDELDTALLHEMIHAVMYRNGLLQLNDEETQPEFYTEGIAEQVVGRDIYYSEVPFIFEILISVDQLLSDNMSMEAGTGHGFTYPAGYTFMRYLTKQSTDGEDVQFSINDDFTVRNVHDEMYLTKTGTQNVLNDSVVGQFNVADDVINYSAIASVEAQNITIDDDNNWIITATDSNDTINVTSDAKVTVKDSSGDDYLAISNGEVVFIGFGDNDTLTFTDGVRNKAVDFTPEGLSFWTDTVMGGSDYLKVTFTDINDTSLINLKYGTEATEVVAFINDGDIYQASLGTAKEYIGAVDSPNQGVSFEGVSDDMNIALDVAGNANEFWNIHSIIGGSGNTTITGTTSDDTLAAGTGKTTITGNGGDDVLIGNSQTTFIINNETLTGASSTSAATVKTSSDGNTTVTGSGDWQLNGNTVTLNQVSSLRGTAADGLEFYSLAMAAYDAAAKQYESEQIIYSETDDTLAGTEENEYIIVSNNEYLDISNGGEDTICLANADTVTIAGYDAKTGSTFLTNTSENLTNLIMYGDPYLLVVGDGYFKADNLGRVVLDGTNTLNGTFVNFTTYDDGFTQLYGWSGQAGGNVDGSEYKQDAIIIGVAPSGYSTLKGGSGDDTIYAAADDVVKLSGGNDIINIDHLDREWRINGNKGGLTINLGDGNISAQTTIKGFDASQDKIAVDDISELSVDSSGDNLKIAVNNSSLTFAAGTDQLIITDDSGTYTIHTNFDNLTPTSNYIIETSDGTFETPDKGLKKSENEYTYSSGDNTITGFNFGADESADELIIDSEIMEVTFDEAGNLKVKVDEDNQLQISNAANKIIKVNANEQDWVVEFGNNLMYNESVNCYGDNTDTRLWVHKDYRGEELAILANGSDGKIYNNVKEITAKAYSGEATLVGNELENVITASKGSSSLWGGEGSDNDTLIGSSGYDEFFYLKGNGNDVIRHAEGNDLINLLDINLEDISSTAMNALSIKIEFNDGGSLSINTLSDLTFQLADGSKWQSNRSSKNWIQK